MNQMKKEFACLQPINGSEENMTAELRSKPLGIAVGC